MGSAIVRCHLHRLAQPGLGLVGMLLVKGQPAALSECSRMVGRAGQQFVQERVRRRPLAQVKAAAGQAKQHVGVFRFSSPQILIMGNRFARPAQVIQLFRQS